jgi:hypothetical protein
MLFVPLNMAASIRHENRQQLTALRRSRPVMFVEDILHLNF